eukprot:5759540-Amphidinium_carterae.1
MAVEVEAALFMISAPCGLSQMSILVRADDSTATTSVNGSRWRYVQRVALAVVASFHFRAAGWTGLARHQNPCQLCNFHWMFLGIQNTIKPVRRSNVVRNTFLTRLKVSFDPCGDGRCLTYKLSTTEEIKSKKIIINWNNVL